MTMIEGYKFTFGADPEMFIAKKGAPVSAFGLIPGTKSAPHKVKNGAVQIDGMALEFNIDPAEDAKGFITNLDAVMKQILDMVPGYDLHKSCVAEFGLDYIKAQPKEASELGCSPDYNAYTMAANPRPAGETPFRTAAGHLHIGWTNGVNPMDPDHFNACARLVKQLDRYLGVPSVIMDSSEASRKRRKLYGAAGAFRPTHFGVEYRVMSNFWLLNEKFPHWKKFVVGNAIEAIKATFKDPESAERPVGFHQAREIINNPNGEEAIAQAKQCLYYESSIPSPKSYA